MHDDEKQTLITDYVRGQCSAEDAARLEEAARTHAALASDIEFTKKLAETVKDSPRPPAPTELGWARLSKAIDRDGRQTAPERAWVYWRYAAMFLGAIAIGQTALLVVNQTNTTEPAYRTASASMDQHVLKVTFTQNAPEAEIRALFLSVNGDIVAGPSAMGVYAISFPDAKSKSDALAAFETSRTLIETVSEE